MPLFQTPSPQRSPLFSPLKSNIDDMVKAVQELEQQLAFFVDDSEAFGLLTEETFLENGPEVLKQLDRVSALMGNSTRDLTLDDDAPGLGNERIISLCLHNFLSTSARALTTLAAQHKAVRSARPLADALARRAAVLRERAVAFKAAMDARRGGDDGGWAAFEGAMAEIGERFPVAPPPVANVVAAA